MRGKFQMRDGFASFTLLQEQPPDGDLRFEEILIVMDGPQQMLACPIQLAVLPRDLA